VRTRLNTFYLDVVYIHSHTQSCSVDTHIRCCCRLTSRMWCNVPVHTKIKDPKSGSEQQVRTGPASTAQVFSLTHTQSCRQLHNYTC
jgi:hypothetical protein